MTAQRWTLNLVYGAVTLARIAQKLGLLVVVYGEMHRSTLISS